MSPSSRNTTNRLVNVCYGVIIASVLASLWGPAAPVALLLPLVVYTTYRIVRETLQTVRKPPNG